MPNNFSLADIASIQTSIPNPYAPAPTPTGTIVAPPAADFSLSDVVNVKAPAPTADFLPSDVVSVAAAAPRVYTPDFIKSTSDAELLADKDFIPVNFGAQNLEAVQADPALREKLVRLYQEQETKGTTAGTKLKAVFTGVPDVAKALAKGAVATGKAAENLSLSSLVIPGGVDRAKQSAAELAASVENAEAGAGDLIRRAGRAVKEKFSPPASWNNRFFDDIAGLKQVEAAGKANGAVLTAFGADAKSLKENFGITVNPETINELSAITDPINFIPVGGAVGAVSKIGGKIVTRTLAATGNAARAAALAATLNAARDAVTAGAGNLVAKAGGAVEGAAAKVQSFTKSAGGTVSGLGLGSILGGDVYSALGGAAVVKGVPAITKAVGSGVRKAGEMIAGRRAVPGALSLVADTATGAVGGFIKGAAEGAVLTLPFEIGARPDEEQFLLGAAGLGGVTRGGIDAVAPTARVAGRAAQNKLAETIFKHVAQSEPAPDAGNYGTDANLDSQHAAAVAKLQPAEAKLVNWARALLRAAGGEVYTVPGAEFKKQTGYDALGYAVSAGEKVGNDGVVKPVFRILLNETAESLPHEFYHALELLDLKQAADFKQSVAASLTPEQRAQFAQLYNSRINGGKPEKTWTLRLSEDQISSEVTAEVFSRLLLAQDLSGVEPGAVQKGALFVSGLLEKLGAPLGGINKSRKNAGVSNLGVRPSTEQVKAGQAWLADMVNRVNDSGTLGEPPKKINFPTVDNADRVPFQPFAAEEPVTITPEEIKPAEAAAPVTVAPEEIAPVAVTPPPAETPPVIVPPTPVAQPVNPPSPRAPAIERRNIRTTRAEQDDFAAKRAEVTNIDKAVEAATDPEAKARVEEIAPHLEDGTVLEIVHQGATARADASPRSVRRAEQEASYIAAAQANAPRDLWDRHQKVFVPVRFEIVAGKPQLLAMSMDKVLANAHQVAHEAAMKGVGDLIPYKLEAGRLTDVAWNEFVGDLQSYNANQANGYRGDGASLTRPDGDAGLSIPAENSAYTPIPLAEDKALFLNLVQGLNPPLTAREVKGSVPGNIKGQILAEVNARTPEKPAVIRPSDINKQTFTSGREIKETNPLRNKLAEAGVDVRELIEVTERINVSDIETVTPRPDLNFEAPVTDTIRGGFLPHDANPDVRAVAEDYAAKAGIKNTPHTGYDKLPPELGKKLADFYESAKSAPDDATVKASYQALATETLAQLDALEAAGYTVEPFTGTGEPYANSAAAVADIRDNKHLYFLKTEGNIRAAADNPMLAPWRDGLVVNDAFRAVHDFFGHGKEGYQFGPRGEFNAWKAHAPMFSDAAQGALAAETLAQNAWVNFGPHSDLPVKERPFAEQKNIVAPPELIAEAKGSFQPRDSVEEVSAMSADEFNAAAKGWTGGLTTKAHEVGKATTTPEGVERLAMAQSRALENKKRLMSAKDYAGAMSESTKAQFFREAHEAATNTGGTAEELVRRKGEFLPGRKTKPTERELREAAFNKAAGLDWDSPPESNLDDIVIQPKTRATKASTANRIGAAAWILPDGEVRSFKDAAFHEQDLAANYRDYNKRFGTKLGRVADAEDRMQALNAGFVRLRNTTFRGLVVEASAERWNSIKPKLAKVLADNADNTVMLSVALLNRKGNEVAGDSLRLAGKADRAGAIKELLNELKPPGESTTRKGPTDIQRARSMGDFLPAENFPDEVDAIDRAAFQSPSGRIFKGGWHGDAFENAVNAGIKQEDVANFIDGFVTRSGKFLNRRDALKHAYRIGQLDRGQRNAYLDGTGKLESGIFEAGRKFLPADNRAAIFYSELQKVVEEKVKGRSVKTVDLGNLLRNSGVKAEEIKWSGLDDFTRGKESVDTGELKQWLKTNDVRIEEVVKGEDAPMPTVEKRGDKWAVVLDSGRIFGEYSNRGDATQALNRANENQLSPTKFEKWQVPGGENYKELLLTLPEKRLLEPFTPPEPLKTLPAGYDLIRDSNAPAERQWGITPPGQVSARFWEGAHPSKEAAIEAALQKVNYERRFTFEEEWRGRQTESRKQNFKSSHWDESNVLAHVRFNQRTDSQGNRVLFVEEVQSDWHQRGRSQGYKGNPDTTGWTAKEGEGDPASGPVWEVRDADGRWIMGVPRERGRTAEAAILRAADSARGPDGNRVPDAPFKKTWPLLAVKRMIRYAAEGNFDKIAWTPGDVQAERYDLSKHIDTLRVSKLKDGMVGLDALGPAPDYRLVISQSVPIDKVADHVGKELATKIRDQKENYHEYEGIDLKVGGEGMRGFYDEILPKEVGAYVKKWGSKVEKTGIPGKPGEPKLFATRKEATIWAEKNLGDHGFELHVDTPTQKWAVYDQFTHERAADLENIQAWSLPITPEMKTDVLTKGQKKFLPVSGADSVEIQAKSPKKNISVEIRSRPVDRDEN